MNDSVVDFRVAKIEGYWALGLYRKGEKEPYEYKIYDNLDYLLMDLDISTRYLEDIQLEINEEIIDLLNLRR